MVTQSSNLNDLDRMFERVRHGLSKVHRNGLVPSQEVSTKPRFARCRGPSKSCDYVMEITKLGVGLDVGSWKGMERLCLDALNICACCFLPI